jgi:hypothetical protein
MDKKRFISIDILAGHLRSDITDTLISFHAFIGEFYFKIKYHVFMFMLLLLNFPGSDVTGNFATKSKEATFKLLLKCDSELLKSFRTLGSNDVDLASLVETLSRFVASMYGSKSEKIEDIRWDRLCRGARPPTASNTCRIYQPCQKSTLLCECMENCR